VVRKLTYEENDLKGETVNIYQKPQALINHLIDRISSEGDWVLDLFSGSCKIYDIIYKSIFQFLLFFNSSIFINFNFCFFKLFT